MDSSIAISIEDSNGSSITDIIIIDLVPTNDQPTATEMDQTSFFDEDSVDNALTSSFQKLIPFKQVRIQQLQ